MASVTGEPPIDGPHVVVQAGQPRLEAEDRGPGRPRGQLGNRRHPGTDRTPSPPGGPGGSGAPSPTPSSPRTCEGSRAVGPARAPPPTPPSGPHLRGAHALRGRRAARGSSPLLGRTGGLTVRPIHSRPIGSDR